MLFKGAEEAYPTTENSSDIHSPVSLIKKVHRSQAVQLLLDESETRKSFGDDPYAVNHLPKSILCSPIMFQGVSISVVYFENSEKTYAFTEAEEEFVHAILSYASTSNEMAWRSVTNDEITNVLLGTSNAGGSDAGIPGKDKLDAPIQHVFESIKTMRSRFRPEDPIIRVIDEVFKTLASDGLFNSNLDQVQDEDGKSIDFDTKDWIQNLLGMIKRQKSSLPGERLQVKADSMMDWNKPEVNA
jgi:hypothetical protein